MGCKEGRWTMISAQKTISILFWGLSLFGLFYSENSYAAGERLICDFSEEAKEMVNFYMDTENKKVWMSYETLNEHSMDVYLETDNFLKAYGDESILAFNKKNGNFIHLSATITNNNELKEDIVKGTCYKIPN